MEARHQQIEAAGAMRVSRYHVPASPFPPDGARWPFGQKLDRAELLEARCWRYRIRATQSSRHDVRFGAHLRGLTVYDEMQSPGPRRRPALQGRGQGLSFPCSFYRTFGKPQLRWPYCTGHRILSHERDIAFFEWRISG